MSHVLHPCLAGTQLSKVLKRFGIIPLPDCPCRERVFEMDRLGCEWCERNIDTITGWLREEAGVRGLPFVDAIAKVLIRTAIRNARRVQSHHQKAG